MSVSSLEKQVNAALVAHAAWKQKLSDAIDTQNRDIPVGRICRDDCCAFGEWFYSCPKDQQLAWPAHRVRRLHAAFHQLAGSIALDIAIGDFVRAKARVAGQEFRMLTGDLQAALNDWKIAA